MHAICYVIVNASSRIQQISDLVIPFKTCEPNSKMYFCLNLLRNACAMVVLYVHVNSKVLPV